MGRFRLRRKFSSKSTGTTDAVPPTGKKGPDEVEDPLGGAVAGLAFGTSGFVFGCVGAGAGVVIAQGLTGKYTEFGSFLGFARGVGYCGAGLGGFAAGGLFGCAAGLTSYGLACHLIKKY